MYQQAQRWPAAGCFETLARDLRAVLRLAAGRAEEPSATIIDSRTLRSTPESGKRAGYDDAKRKRVTKLHLALEVVKLPEAKRGFVLLPRRWVVERSFAWATRCKDWSRITSVTTPLWPVCRRSVRLLHAQASRYTCRRFITLSRAQ